MLQPALKRLFLVLFPIILFVTALYLSHIRPTQKGSAFKKKEQTLKDSCPFYLGVSFFSQKQKFQAKGLTTYILSESAFIKKIQDLNWLFQTENLSLKQVFFTFPLTLTKNEDWIVSQKSFFILPTGERKQISHLTYFEINNFHKLSHQSDLNVPLSVKDSSRLRGNYKQEKNLNTQGENLNRQEKNSQEQRENSNTQLENPNAQKESLNTQNRNSNKRRINEDYKALKLDKLLSSLPKKSNFLFYLLESDRKKTIKNLNKIQNKTQGNLYLSSSNEKLLKDLLLYRSCSNLSNSSKGSLSRKDCLSKVSNRVGLSQANLSLKPNIKILHSFKTLIRLEMLSVLPQSFKQIEGDGIILPDILSPSLEILSFLRQKNKLLFFEKDPPYSIQDKHWIKNSQALISSQAKLAISSIRDKKTCLIKH